MEPLTGTAAFISAVGLISIIVLITVALVKHTSKETIEVPSSILRILGGTAAIGMSVLLIANFAPGFAATAGIITPAEAAVGPIVEPVTITAAREGYVLASVEDAYLVPKTAVTAVTLYASQSQPIPNVSWPALMSENTGTGSSALLEVPGVVSGTVYVTAGKTLYYPDVTTTSITGAQVIEPSLVADMQLAQMGDLNKSLHENTNALRQGSDVDNIVMDNTVANTSASFTLRIKTDNAWKALRDVRVLFVRGADWTALGATMAPVVTRNAGLAVSYSGDVTLTSEVTGEITFTGDITFGNYVEITFVTAVTTADNATMATIYIDDLNGTKDVLGGTGIAEETILIRTLANA